MSMQTPFFRGFNQVLFGRQPVSTTKRVTRQIEKVKGASLSGLAQLFGEYLGSEFFPPPVDSGPNSRERFFGVATTFWASEEAHKRPLSVLGEYRLGHLPSAISDSVEP